MKDGGKPKDSESQEESESESKISMKIKDENSSECPFNVLFEPFSFIYVMKRWQDIFIHCQNIEEEKKKKKKWLTSKG